MDAARPRGSSVDRIVAEAERLFAQSGLDGTSLASIATAAGLGNAGVLHHFPSKNAVYAAVLDAVGDDLDDRLDEASMEPDPRERLRKIAQALGQLSIERPTALRVIAQEFIDTTGRIDTAAKLPLAGAVRVTVTAIIDGQRVGAVVDGDPYALTSRLHGTLLYGALGHSVLARVSADDAVAPGLPDGWGAALVDAALSGLLT